MSRIKNLWNNRRANTWIFIELVIVTIVAWIIADPVVVALSDVSLPTGYDNDRLVIADVARLDELAPAYDASRDSIDVNNADVETILMKLRSHPAVESVTIDKGFGLPGGGSNAFNTPSTGNLAVDTVVKMTNQFYYYSGTDYFQTLGIKSAPGSPSPEELSDAHIKSPSQIIISRELGELYWPGENAVGKRFILNIGENGDTAYMTVAAVVEGIRHQPPYRSYCAIFECADEYLGPGNLQQDFKAVIRLKDKRDIQEQCEEIALWGLKELAVGNFYLRTVETYDTFLENTSISTGLPNVLKLRYILAGFFLINLIFGMVGTFWLQTRKRMAEMGIRRAFGSRKRGITGGLVAENVVLATVATLTGFLLYWQYAMSNGLDTGFGTNVMLNVVDNWIADFGEHFLLVSAIVYLLVIICTVAGTLIPAVSVSRVQIVEALRSKE